MLKVKLPRPPTGTSGPGCTALSWSMSSTSARGRCEYNRPHSSPRSADHAIPGSSLAREPLQLEDTAKRRRSCGLLLACILRARRGRSTRCRCGTLRRSPACRALADNPPGRIALAGVLPRHDHGPACRVGHGPGLPPRNARPLASGCCADRAAHIGGIVALCCDAVRPSILALSCRGSFLISSIRLLPRGGPVLAWVGAPAEESENRRRGQLSSRCWFQFFVAVTGVFGAGL